MKKSILLAAACAAFLSVSAQQWIQQTPPSGITQELYAVYSINNTLIGASGAEVVIKTTDGGASWVSNFQAGGDLFDDINAGDNTLYFSHSATTSTWQVELGATSGVTLSAGKPTGILGNWKTSLNNGCIVGIGGKIEITTNAGSSWTPVTSGTTQDLHGVHFTSATVGYAVGNNGTILKTTNGGTSWTTLTSGTTANLKDVWFGDANTGYAVGAGGAILKTTSAGASWVGVLAPITTQLNDVCFINASKGYICGDGGLIYQTLNGGGNWQSMTSGTSLDLNGIHFSADSVGWCVGGSSTANIILKFNSGVPVGISEVRNADLVSVYPNPSKGLFNVQLKQGPAEVEVRDLSGKLITRRKMVAGNQQLDLTEQAKGVYVLRVSSGEATEVKKIILN